MEQVKKIIKLCSFFTVQTNLKYISRCPLFEWRLILTCNMNTGLVFEWWSELQAKYCLLFRCHSINGSYNVRAGLKHSSMTLLFYYLGAYFEIWTNQSFPSPLYCKIYFIESVLRWKWARPQRSEWKSIFGRKQFGEFKRWRSGRLVQFWRTLQNRTNPKGVVTTSNCYTQSEQFQVNTIGKILSL